MSERKKTRRRWRRSRTHPFIAAEGPRSRSRCGSQAASAATPHGPQTVPTVRASVRVAPPLFLAQPFTQHWCRVTQRDVRRPPASDVDQLCFYARRHASAGPPLRLAAKGVRIAFSFTWFISEFNMRLGPFWRNRAYSFLFFERVNKKTKTKMGCAFHFFLKKVLIK